MRMTPLGDPVDPFDEQQRPLLRRRADLLGATFEFLADDEPLLAPVDAAYAGVPPQRLGDGPALQVRLRRGETAGWPPGLDRPPAARHLSGAGVFGVALDAVNMTLVMPELGRALVTLSPELLDRPRRPHGTGRVRRLPARRPGAGPALRCMPAPSRWTAAPPCSSATAARASPR